MRRYRVTFDRKAEKQLERIRVRQTVLALRRDIFALAEDPRPPGCEKLSGFKDHWRIRVGDWRVVYRIEDGELVVLVLTVAPRGRVYKDL